MLVPSTRGKNHWQKMCNCAVKDVANPLGFTEFEGLF